MDIPKLWPIGPLPATTYIVLVLSTLYILLTQLSRRRIHSSEPPIVSPSIPIPYVGHLIGMAVQGGHYLKSLGLNHSALPIFTVVVPFTRLYIVTSPPLAVAIQRRPARQFSFNALLPDVVQRVMGLDLETKDIVTKGLDPERGEGKGFLADLHDMLVSFLGPGKELEELTVQAVVELGDEVDQYATEVLSACEGKAAIEELLPFIRHLVAPSTARLLYGTRNPFELYPDQNLEDAFWSFDHGLGRLLMGLFPSITASQAYYGRERLVAAFRTYIEAEHYKPAGDGGRGASQIILNRIRTARSHGFSVDGIARSEVSFLFAGIVNTATTTFWTLLRIFADRDLVATIRAELEDGAAVTQPTGEAEGQTRKLSLAALARDGYRACAMLHAVYKEVLRLGSNHFSTRLVQTDTVLAAAGRDGEYFLRSGGIVQIAGGVMHASEALWGKDAAVFDPSRHLRGLKNPHAASSEDNAAGDGADETKNGARPSVHPAAFRAFGGGRTMCPGRHFATGEILGFVAVVLLRFDIAAADEDQTLRVPDCDDYILPVHVLEPVSGEPVRVRIRMRDGVDGGRVEVVP